MSLLKMPELTKEALLLRERLSRYPGHSREELNKILKIEFEFVQLLDVILRLYPLNAPTLSAIAYLEESRTWAGLSVKRGYQPEFEPSVHPLLSKVHVKESDTLDKMFQVVLSTILNRCVSNREMDLALTRLEQARSVLLHSVAFGCQ